MQQAISDAAERVVALKNTLYATEPEAQREALALSRAVVDPASGSADAVWSAMWSKPLYSARYVVVAERWQKELDPKMQSAWQHMEHDSGPYAIARHVEMCRSGRRKVNKFTAIGERIVQLRSEINVPLKCHYAIVGAGAALAKRAKVSDHPFDSLAITGITAETIAALQAELGIGWGHITVMHMLTDLGLCCKPDVHLLNTMRALGLYSKKPKSNPTLKQALEVDALVKALAVEIDGKITPQSLRELDKNLMDMSRLGLI